MTKSPAPSRRLHSGHFAFMRALAQGLDERASWDRYLRLEGEHSDRRTVRRTIAWIRDAFAAAAKRENKPGSARLILLDPARLPAAPQQPSLAEFAAAQGMEEFSEAEQLEAYEEAYPPRGRKGAREGGAGQGASASTRRGRLIERQLEALRWLQGLAAHDPRPGDRVGAWLHPLVAARLERAGLLTLSDLVERINGAGARWWVPVAGVGARKAARIVEWLQAHEAVLGARVGPHAVQRRSDWTVDTLIGVMPPATALRPFEKFLLPTALDGRAGRFRAPLERCRLGDVDDHAALAAWLRSKQRGRPDREPSATQRAYRKEAERLLLWAILERKKPLSSLAVEDAAAFTSFLGHPPAAWCGPRHRQRWSPLWRPFEGPLSPAARRHALTVLRGLFAFLMDQGYVTGNPFAALAPPVPAQRPLEEGRTLTLAQWEGIEGLLQVHGDTEPRRRLRRGMRWLRATGLRLAELTRLKCEDLQPVESQAADGSRATGWVLTLGASGGRSRQASVPQELVDELAEELVRFGLDRAVSAPGNRGIHVMARFDAALARPVAWSASGLYQAIKAFLVKAADHIEGEEGQRLRKASTHWVRHGVPHPKTGGRTSSPRWVEVVTSNAPGADPPR
ncbi:phage integrase family protein [Variovorax saccharolyticus]|uniref:phage integrase family protein n=1 Tax=Variovorax saccharolyticus TaxID=3053516 RepID=UPI002576A756|nr:phage integrase family protein [Variovorax sp. J31P216]MDM0029801.1 phage integrase family protein [Variovorax sp. J31P216]